MTETDAPRFSVVGLAVAVVTVGTGTAAGLAFVPAVGTYLGMVAGGVVAGLVLEERPLLESGVAAVLANLGILLAGTLVGNDIVAAVLALASISPVTLLVSVVLSFAVGAFGAHFGDDLRDGLTAPVEASDPTPTAFGAVGSQSRATEPSAVERADDDRPARESNGSETDRQSVESETEQRPENVESDDSELEREK